MLVNGHSILDGAVFKNNIYNLYAAPGRVCNSPSCTAINPFRNNPSVTPYFVMNGDLDLEIPESDSEPLASFSEKAIIGGLAYSFDASASIDSDYVPVWTDNYNGKNTAGDNTIASFMWDFDNDGQFDDGFGRYIEHIFNSEGSKLVRLKIYDVHGNSNEFKKTINVRSTCVFSPNYPVSCALITQLKILG